MSEDVLDLLRVEVPREIESHVPTAYARRNDRGRCVQATRVGIEALRYFGIEARPLVTTMMVGNEDWVRWMLDGQPLPMPDEVWSVGIDPEPREDRGYPAHLVIEIDGQILDLDAGFYSRPHKGIYLPPSVIVPIQRQDDPHLPIAALDLDDGGAIVYHDRAIAHHVPPPDYRSTGAWKQTGKWTGPVIRRMREALALQHHR